MSSTTGHPRPTGRGSPPTPARGIVRYSMYDPIHFGIDETGLDVWVTLMYRNLLIGGEPGAGKSSLLNTVVAHGALSLDCELWLFDGKRVELGLWRDVAREFIGNDIIQAITTLVALQYEMDIRYLQLEAVKRRKIVAADQLPVIMAVIDELAYYTTIAGTKEHQELFITLLLDLVARGRAVGVIVVAATQRPSADIVPTRVRDIFGYRVAFRCTTDSSSDIILANGWAAEGFNARDIAPTAQGVGFILEEGGTPFRFKAGYLTDHDIYALVTLASDLRDIRPTGTVTSHGHLIAVA